MVQFSALKSSIFSFLFPIPTSFIILMKESPVLLLTPLQRKNFSTSFPATDTQFTALS